MSDFDKNAELLRRAKEGDSAATDELVLSNLGLCKSIALKFRDRGVEYEDLVQIGTIGMIKAIKSFDFSYNTAFSTYAVPLIIGEIRRYLRDDGMIKVSRTVKKCGADAMRKKEEFVRQHGREPHIGELAELCGVPRDELVYALEAMTPVRSIYEPTGDDDGMTLESMIADKSEEIEERTDRIALCEAIKTLPELWRKIVILRYFKGLSQQQTGKMLGITQVKVSREEKKIMECLRDAL